MRYLKAIFFDLDDTLWDMEFVIPRAEQHLYEWFAQHYPRVAETYTPEGLHSLRHEIGVRHPELRHDLSRLRIKMLREVFRRSGYTEHPVGEAFEVFQEARNRVTLFADVQPVLAGLGKTHRLFVLTNGNASLKAIGISDWFEDCLTARELGVAKPDTDFYRRALQATGVTAAAALHVGDHPENDIQAAAAAGLTTLWLNRRRLEWSLPDCSPDHELPDLERLPAMLLS